MIKSLSFKINTGIFLSLLLILIPLGFYEYHNYKLKEIKRIDNELANVFERLNSSLILPLWNHDLEGIKAIVYAEMAGRYVNLIEVKDERDGSVLISFVRNEKWIPVDSAGQEINIPVFKSIEDEIRIGVATVGWLRVGVSDKYLMEDLDILAQRYLIRVALIFFISNFLFMWITRMLVVKPILDLEKTINQERLDSKERPIKIKRNDEIGRLANAYRDMRERLKILYEEREQRIKDLETAQKELLAGELERRDIINFIPDAVIGVNELGIVRAFNSQAEKLFGYSAAAIIGEPVSLIVSNDEFLKYKETVANHLENSNEYIVSFDLQIKAKDAHGRNFLVRLSIAELPKTSDGIRNFICSCHDMTESKQQEEQLRHIQKMEALGVFSGGIAHDYNNILAIILGYTHLLEDNLMTNAEQLSYVVEIRKAAERAANLTDKLLDITRQKMSKTKVVDINDVLQNESEFLKKSLTPNVTLELRLENSICPVNINPDEFINCLYNMCINSMYAMDGQGQITISTANENLPEQKARALGLHVGNYAVVRVQDTGTGISEQDTKKIFDPFFTTKGVHGTGLGLSQAHSFMRRCRGIIDLEDGGVGKGAIFSLYFPSYEAKAQPGMEPEADRKPFTSYFSGSETILLVDDEAMLAQVTARQLERLGYQVLCALTGDEALGLLQTQRVDMVISDIIMPGMNGYELAIKIRQKYPTIKIQLTSGYNDRMQLPDIDMSLHNNLIYKPTNILTLVKAIRKQLDSSDEAE